MIYNVTLQNHSEVPKFRQIANIMSMDIDNGLLKKRAKVPSINEFSKTNKVARETVEKAYKVLKEQGYLVSISGKGNFVAEKSNSVIKVLMLLNKFSSYKKEVYDAFKRKLGKNAIVDIKIYDYNPKIFCDIIEDNNGKYNFYVVMPHFYSGVDEAPIIEKLNKISKDKLLILDRDFGEDISIGAVYQNFEEDIFEAFSANNSLFDNYNAVKILFPETCHHPKGIISGVSKFCEKNSMELRLVKDIKDINPVFGEIFITLTDSDLSHVIKEINSKGLRQGIDVGIISFNETVFKELLEITVVTTDFAKMGETAANMIVENKYFKVRNKFRFIKRLSI